MTSARGTALACVLLAALALACLPLASAFVGESGGAAGARRLLQVPPPGPAVPPCVDRPTPEGFTCDQQKGWGKCTESWMTAGGFCRRTCNQCNLPLPPQPQAAAVGPSTAPADSVESVRAAAPATEAPVSATFCTQLPQTGPCRSAIRSWYYDAVTATCMPFLYGGCQGNENRFPSFDECDQAAMMMCADWEMQS